MELSVMIARIISVIYLSSGIAVVIKQLNFNRIVDDLNQSPALTFIAGSFGLIFGMALVTHHNHWVKDWTILITFVSWGLLIGGFTIILIPQSLSWISKVYKHSPAWGLLPGYPLKIDYI